MGKIATNMLASGNGWSVADVVCTFGPQDRSFEEQHTTISITIVVEGSFQYRSAFRIRRPVAGLTSAWQPGTILSNADTSMEPAIVVWPSFTRRNSLNAQAWPVLFPRTVFPRFQICRHGS